MSQVTDAAVKAFVEERPGMTFVGLLATDAGFSDFLSGEGNLKVWGRCTLISLWSKKALKIIFVKLYSVCKQVTGEANETQICEALRRYSEREGFVREALFHLFSLTHVMEKPRPDILKVSSVFFSVLRQSLYNLKENNVFYVCKMLVLMSLSVPSSL